MPIVMRCYGNIITNDLEVTLDSWDKVAQANELARRAHDAFDTFDTDDEDTLVPTIDPAFAQSERERANKDSETSGLGFLVNGVRVDPKTVVIVRSAFWPDMTTTELYRDLERVLRDKKASDAWIEYALPDLQHAAAQFAYSQFSAGHKSGTAGEPLPNAQGAL